MKNKPNSYLCSEEDLPLIQFTHTFAQASIWFEEGWHRRFATYDLYIRELPKNRNFLVFGGLEEIVNWIKKIRFSKSDIDFLLKAKLITKSFANYLKKFRFSGDIYAMPEGTICFPGEPIIRIQAPIIEASLIEAFLIEAVTSNTIFFTKAARLKLASNNRYRLSTGILRAHSFESGIKAARCAFLCDISSMATPAVSKKYSLSNTNYTVNAQHLFISSFESELEAFQTMAKHFPQNCSFMIDTYDVEKGLENAIKVANQLKEQGHSLSSITVDSGDISENIKFARKKLDEANLPDVKIIAAGNLDEFKIKKMADNGVPADILVAATEYITVSDAPTLETVYKLSQLSYGGKVTLCGKFATGKRHYPGVKQVFRIFQDGLISRDIIGLEDEKLGHPLLIQVMSNGKITAELPSLEEIKIYFNHQLSQLPSELKAIDKNETIAVDYSKKLSEIFLELKEKHQHNFVN